MGCPPSIAQWEEGFEGGSKLFGAGSDFLVRRTAYIATPRVDAEAGAGGTQSGTDGLLSAAGVGHATWSSRVNDRAEITLRYLRGDTMVVERTLVMLSPSNEVLRCVVSEEVFVRAAGAS